MTGERSGELRLAIHLWESFFSCEAEKRGGLVEESVVVVWVKPRSVGEYVVRSYHFRPL